MPIARTRNRAGRTTAMIVAGLAMGLAGVPALHAQEGLRWLELASGRAEAARTGRDLVVLVSDSV